MKNIIFTFIFIVSISLISCEKSQDDWALNYYLEHYSRLIDSEGGLVNFFRIYENDSIMVTDDKQGQMDNIYLSVGFPENALDSSLIINAYELENFQVVSQEIGDYVAIASDFIYFIAVPPSSGYLAETTTPIRGEFNYPATVTYNIDTTYNPNDQFALYRIGIPAMVEIQSTGGGYIGGYDTDEIASVIAGYLTPDGWTTTPSIANWELYTNQVVEYDWENHSITFKISNFNHIYCIAKMKTP